MDTLNYFFTNLHAALIFLMDRSISFNPSLTIKFQIWAEHCICMNSPFNKVCPFQTLNIYHNVCLASCDEEVDLSPNLLNCYHTFLDCQIFFFYFFNIYIYIYIYNKIYILVTGSRVSLMGQQIYKSTQPVHERFWSVQFIFDSNT